MNRVTVKTSTIFISKGERTRVFHSIREVPPNLRRQLEETTNSFNSATILIADRRGKQEILKALSALPAGLRGRLATSLDPRSLQFDRARTLAPGKAKQILFWMRHRWLEISLPVAVGLVVWAAFNYR